MRSSSPLISYRQVLETRQRGLTELEVRTLLNQLLVEIAKYHAIGQTHGDLSLESLWRDVVGDLYMNPPLGLAKEASPRGDVAAIARVAIELLTNQVPSPHWQRQCSIQPALAEVLEQAHSNFSRDAPQNASEFLQAIQHPQMPEPSTIPKNKPGFNPMSLVQGAGKWFQRIIQSVLVLGVLSVAGGLAYEHFSTLIFEKLPVSRPNDNPVQDPANKANPKPSTQTERPKRAIVVPTNPEDSEPSQP
jgi:serine/threonine protein kinase